MKEQADIFAQVKGKNINEQTLLATDYLNHFNEIVMLIEMVPDMPECLDDILEWTPKSYTQHFEDSSFTEKELAITAYAHVPEEFLNPFETCVANMDRLVLAAMENLEGALMAEANNRVSLIAAQTSNALRKLIDTCGAIINGTTLTVHQEDIDQYFALESSDGTPPDTSIDVPAAPPTNDLAQDDIDALFN